MINKVGSPLSMLIILLSMFIFLKNNKKIKYKNINKKLNRLK